MGTVLRTGAMVDGTGSAEPSLQCNGKEERRALLRYEWIE